MNREEDALLKEYEVCYQNNNASASTYWVIFGIFIGISSVILGGLIYGVLANDAIREVLFLKTIDDNMQMQIVVLSAIILLLSIGIIIILYTLKAWLRRIAFLADMSYDRIREIEDLLGIEISHRINGLDIKYDPKRSGEWKELPEEWQKKINSLSERFPRAKCCKFPKPFRRYEPPTRNRHFSCIFYLLVILWFIVSGAALSRLIITITC